MINKLLVVSFILLPVACFAQWADTTKSTLDNYNSVVDTTISYSGKLAFDVSVISYEKRLYNLYKESHFEYGSFILSYCGKLNLGEKITFEFKPGFSVGDLLFGFDLGLYLRHPIYNKLFGRFGVDLFKAIDINLEGSHNNPSPGIKEGTLGFPLIAIGYQFNKRLALILSFCPAKIDAIQYSRSNQNVSSTYDDLKYTIRLGIEI